MTNFESHQSADAEAGFAYLWTLLLVALLGLGLAEAGEVYGTTLQREREAELLFIGGQFRDAIGRYYEAQLQGGRHEYPAHLEDLLRDNRFPELRRYLRKIYIDPITGHPEWGFVQVSGRIAGVYSMSDGKPLKQDGFETTEHSFQGKERYDEWKFTYPSDLLLQKQSEPQNMLNETVGAAMPSLFPSTSVGKTQP